MNERYQKEYLSKLCTVDEAAKIIESGGYVAVPPVQGEPVQLCETIANQLRSGDLRNMTITNVWTLGKENPLFSEEFHNQVEIDSTFICDAYRWTVGAGARHFVPANYTDVPRLFTRGYRKVKVFIAEVASMDRHGYFNLSLALSHSQTILRCAEKVIFIVNHKMPRVFGDTAVHISQVDCIVEHTHDLVELHAEGTNPNAMAMAGYIADMVPDGACLQVGVGGVPNAVAGLLRDKRDLGIHTELFCECMIDLIECGAVNNSRKEVNRGKSVFTFAMGTKRMYDYVDENPGVETYEVDYINDPTVIAKNKNVISINATLQVDLTDQCCSEPIGFRQYSGVGGQADFCYQMADVLAVRDDYRSQTWRMLIQECSNSGLKKREFCRRRGISEKGFYYWLRKLRSQMAEAAEPQIVQLESSVTSTEILQIQYRGAELKLPADVDIEAVAALLRSIQSL